MSKRSGSGIRRAAPVFAALGDSARLTLMVRLSRGESLSITRLAEGLPMSRQAVTKHLHVLENAGLIRCRKRGREQQWQLDDLPLFEARRILERISQDWGDALGRLKAFAEKE